MTTTQRRTTVRIALLLLGVTRPVAWGGDPVTEGHALYIRHCAACHGLAADGKGPVAVVLTTPPRDLRALGQRYGSPLPVDRIAQFIDGREIVTAHGPRTMPVWGEQLGDHGGKAPNREALARSRIETIVAWLATIQAN